MSQSPGLMFVVSRPIDESQTPEALYHRFYNSEHLPDIIAHGVAKIALRYRNADPKSDTRFVALYPVADVNYLASNDLATFVQETKKSRVLMTEDIYTKIEFGLCPFKKIQTFETVNLPSSGKQEPAKTIVAVAMEPAAGQEADFDDWYRKQHLDMLSMCKGYLRCTRYVRTDGQKPSYLALHEYDCTPSALPNEQLKIVVNTEWSKAILSAAEMFDRNVFELIQAQGDSSVRL